MRGNPLLRVASTHPFHRSGPITDDPHTEAGLQQQVQADDGPQERLPLSELSARAVAEPPRAADLADPSWGSRNRVQGTAPNLK